MLETENIVPCLHSVIITISGIGSINGETILGKIGNIHCVSTPGNFLASAGLAPSDYQSKNFQAKNPRMSKIDSRALSYTLMDVANNVVKNNTTYLLFYNSYFSINANFLSKLMIYTLYYKYSKKYL